MINQENISVREPVLNESSAESFSSSALDRQWTLVTEAVKRELLHSPEVRQALIQFCSAPLSENLPKDFLEAMSDVSTRVAKLAQRYDSSLVKYLELPPVPDDQMIPDIRLAKALKTVSETLTDLQDVYGDDAEAVESEFQNYVHNGSFSNGITEEERALVLQRYRYARDIKLLALGAEIIEHADSYVVTDGITHLPSGVSIALEDYQLNEHTDLLSPATWRWREQYKDRVYKVQTNTGEFILKEKKTARHSDTFKHGHGDGNTSIEEYEIAKVLHANAMSLYDVSACWEKPVLAVTYPDGYQFVVFETEHDLIKDEHIHEELAAAILERAEIYRDEYDGIVTLANKLGSEIKPSFEEYATAKAFKMITHSEQLLKELFFRSGYKDYDSGLDCMFRIKAGADKHLNLETVGYDTEYVSSQTPEEIDKLRAINAKYLSRLDNIRFREWREGKQVTAGERVVYVLLEGARVG